MTDTIQNSEGVEVRRNPEDCEWTYCPSCKTGSLDTGYECNACGFDALPLVLLQEACEASGDRMHPSGLYQREIDNPIRLTVTRHSLAREPATADVERVDYDTFVEFEGWVREYRESMNADVLHLWARDMVETGKKLLAIRDQVLDAALSRAAPSSEHPDDAAVDRFAVQMKAKLAAARAKGRGGWDDPAQCSTDHLRRLLHDHLSKGDPIDVANFCMMLAYYGASTAAPSSEPAIAEGERPMLAYAHMRSGGRCDWRQLREAVSEAIRGNREVEQDERSDIYTGHRMVEGMNYNSLDRIVTAFVDAALAQSSTPPASKRVAKAIFGFNSQEEVRARAAITWLHVCGMIQYPASNFWAVYDMTPFEAFFAAPSTKPATVKEKPVAWSYKLANRVGADGAYSGWDEQPRFSPEKPRVPPGSIRNLIPLYAASPTPSNDTLQGRGEVDEKAKRLAATVADIRGLNDERCCTVCGSRHDNRNEPYCEGSQQRGSYFDTAKDTRHDG